MTRTLSVICDSFNQSRYRPHENFDQFDEIRYIKLNKIKYDKTGVPKMLLELLLVLFNRDYVFIDVAPLNPIIIYLMVLKTLKKDKIVFNSSFISWEKNYRFLDGSVLTPIFERLWFSFIQDIKIRAINSTAYEYLSANGTKELVKKIPHSVDLGTFYYQDIKSEVFTILFVGRMVDEKGIDTILELSETFPGWKFILVGDGEKYNKVARASQQNIELYGHISDDKALNTLYNLSDVFILPSEKNDMWQELFGIVLIEAMATKTPVVATDCVGPQDIITHRENGFLVSASSKYDEYQRILQEIYNQKNMRSNIGKRSYQAVENEYCVGKISQELENFILNDIN